MEAVECGAASLAMVLAYHGHHAPLSEVRQACGISRDGSTAANIVGAAEAYGLEPTPQSLEPAELADVEGPSIIHWEMNHFVVLEEWTPKGAWILDPGAGRRFVATDVFDESFTGVCIELTPTEDFVLRPKARVTAGRYLALLRGARRPLAMVLCASLALNALATVVPLTTEIAIDHVVGRRRVDWLFVVIGSAAALVTFSALWSLLRGRLLVRMRTRLDVAIAEQFVGHLLALPVPFFGQRSVADLMSRVQANRMIRDMLAGQSVGILADGTMLLAYLALMFVFDAQLSAIVLVAGAIYVGVFLVGRPFVRAGADEVQRKGVLASTALLQILRGITTIKSAGVERTSHDRWLNAWIAALNASGRNALRQQTVQSVLLAIQSIVPLVVLLAGGARVLDGRLTPGRLVAFQMLQAGFLLPLQSVVQALLGLQTIPVLLGRMDDVLLSEKEATGTRKCPRLEGEIELRDVMFRYGPTSDPVLEQVSLKIEKGTKVALVGPSGSGKSTLARLLLGLYAPTEGSVLLDGHDLAELDLASVRRQYGVVLQETALFDGTIADNLRLFYPNAPLEHVVQAARVAQLHDDILALPRGYDTRISSSAGPLSGGQRQRLALARAIVHRPPIMILDEATSALDAATEAAIERYLSTRACTRVVIAHRLSTVRDADTIFVIDQGRIVERGRHDELLAEDGLYARLVRGESEPPEPSEPPPEKQPIGAEDLSTFEALASWSDVEREELAEQLQRVDLGDGARVVEQDARATGLYLIVEGTVAVELAEPGLVAWTVTEFGAGAIFGEAGLLDGSPSSASVVARTPLRLLHLPYARYQELLQRGDVLAARATLSLGALVAGRMRDAVLRRDELSADGGREKDRGARHAEPGERRELALGETLLGASLDEAELDGLEGLARRVVVPSGGQLFVRGGAADALYVLRAGHVALESDRAGTLAVLDPGAILGETSVFDDGAHPTTAHALDDVVVFALPRDELVELLLSGQRVMRKLLAPITNTLTRRFRVANYRLREAVALERGELDRAHAAREQALEAAREEREALLVGANGPRAVPVVMARDASQSAAACVTALLRAAGRPTPLSAVLESFAAQNAGPTRALPAVVRSFGLACRKLEVPLDGLRALTAPVLAVVEDGKLIVVERRTLAGWHVMDPMRGRVILTDDALGRAFAGAGFEVRDEAATPALASLPERAAGVARARFVDFLRLVAVTLLLQAVTMGMALATAAAVERVFPMGDRPLLRVLVAAGAALAVAFAVLQQLQGRATEHLRAHFDRELLDQMMTHVLRLPIAFFDRYPPGEVLQRFQAFQNVRALFSTQGVAALLSVTSVLVGAVILLSLSPRLFGVAFVVLVVYAVATRLLFPALRRAAADEVAARGRQQDRLIEILQGVVTLRMTGDMTGAQQRWLPTFLEELAAALRRDGTIAIAMPILEGTRGLALVGCVWIGTRDVLDGSMSLGALVGFLAVLATFLAATHGLALQVLTGAPALVDYGLVRATFVEPREQTAPALLSPGQLRGRVAVEQVSFRYGDGPLVLQEVSLQIESGMKVALVGASGSGKSTLGRLLLGLYLPTSGRILFDGRDVMSMELEALRRRMGVVLQDPFLLSGSIRENIALGAEGASMDRVVETAKRAAVHDDIEKMAMGYETLVAEGGSTFSGGQRQRLVIARALVGEPAILLLDEATSALDNLSQAVIERHLAQSTATRIVIAHRLSTIVSADRIVVMHKGRIAEQGTHEELLERKGIYFDLVRAQL